MAELFDLIELDLERVGDHRFEGTASIPIPPDGGEVWGEVPRRVHLHTPVVLAAGGNHPRSIANKSGNGRVDADGDGQGG